MNFDEYMEQDINESEPAIAMKSEAGYEKPASKILTQWAVVGDNAYQATSRTIKKFKPGFYEMVSTPKSINFVQLDIKSDELIRLQDSLADEILDDIKMFWNKEQVYRKYGFIHHRGYLLYGAQGSGKTSIVQMIAHDLISQGDVVFVCKDPWTFLAGIKDFRQVEPDRRCICIFEDIEAMIKHHGDSEILSYLDGEMKIDKVLNIATTNYPELLDKRITGRPRRFDRVIKIGYPNLKSRQAYFESKLSKKDAIRWAELTDNLSFASLAELVISVKCLDKKLEPTIVLLRDMQTKFESIDEQGEDKLGFMSTDVTKSKSTRPSG